MSRARDKGTRYENQLLPFIQVFAPEALRAPLMGTNDKGDYVNTPWPIEAKNRSQLRVLEWARVIARKSTTGWWWLIFKPGDQRQKGALGDVVVMPLRQAVALAEAYQQQGETNGRNRYSE